MKRVATVTVLGAALLATAALPLRADEHHEGERRHEGERWHDGIERFHERDFHLWREGRWEHRWHDGRYGWWWLAGGLWYFYPRPVYPYPDPYVPPVVQVPPAPVAPPPANVAPQAQTWYYCDSPQGYYPYVPACRSGWRAVPAQPR